MKCSRCWMGDHGDNCYSALCLALGFPVMCYGIGYACHIWTPVVTFGKRWAF